MPAQPPLINMQNMKSTVMLNLFFVDYLGKTVTNFVKACHDYDEVKDRLTLSLLNTSQYLNVIKIVNSKVMDVERAFIHPEGLVGQHNLK